MGGYADCRQEPQPFGSGAFAEYAVMPAKALAPKPPSLTFAEAATLPIAGLTALQGLRDVGKIQAGQRVLINGASGGVGAFAVQLAKAFGAEVTAVCSTRNVAQAQALGADQVIDYTQTDFTQSGQQYDLIFDILGRSSFDRCKGSLKPNGVYLAASFKMQAVGQMIWTKMFGAKKVICAFSDEKSCFSMFSATGSLCLLSVAHIRRRPLHLPRSPPWRINRATRFRPQRIPCACSSAWMRGLP